MKILRSFHSFGLVLNLSLVLNMTAQDKFRNLGFDIGEPVPIPGDLYGRVYAQTALPYWNAYSGTNQQNAIPFNTTPSSLIGIAVLNHRSTGYIAGQFTVFLQTGLASGFP